MKKIKNVVVVCDYAFFEGGAANVAIQTVLAFAKYTKLNVYCFTGGGKSCEELINSNINIINLNMPDLLRNPNRVDAFLKGIYNKKAGFELKKLLLTLNKDETIVHIHTWTKILSSSVFKICEELEFKTFLTIHEYFLTCPNGACYNYVDKRICEIKPLSYNCIICNCDARSYAQKIWRCIRQVKQNSIIRHNENLKYIFISKYQKMQIQKRVPEIDDGYIVKNPINIKERHRIEVENNEKYIYIGRLSGEKGPELFCEAVKKSKVKAIVIGDGILKNELIQNYPEIDFKGWLDKEQIKYELKETRALIFPTLWYEGSPLVVQEVQSQGIPCIVTDCSSAIDDVENDVSGKIVKADVNSVFEAIKKFEDDSYLKKLSINTYDKFDETRTSEKFYVDKLINIYNN